MSKWKETRSKCIGELVVGWRGMEPLAIRKMNGGWLKGDKILSMGYLGK